MQQIVLLAPWNSYADAVDHYCYVHGSAGRQY